MQRQKDKCDRLEPCTQCKSKGIADECRRKLRKPQSKNKRPFPPRRKTIPNPQSNSNSQSIPLPDAFSHSQGPLFSPKPVPLPSSSTTRHWAHLPHPIVTNSDSSFSPVTSPDGTTPQTSVASASFSAAVDSFSKDFHRSSDDSSYESDSDSEHDSIQDSVCLVTAPDSPCPYAIKNSYAEWKTESLLTKRQLIQEIRHLLPDWNVCQRLLWVIYLSRVQPIHDSIIHLPFVEKVLREILLDPNFEERERFGHGTIACALMVMVLAHQFMPVDRGYPWHHGTTLEAYQHDDVRIRQRKLHAIVKRLLKFETSFSFSTVHELQTAILMLVYAKGGKNYLDTIFDAAVRSAMRMRLHRLGQHETIHQPGVDAAKVVNSEMAVRCWWFLVRRDWITSQRYRTYRILPSQFDTRLPLNLSDDDLTLSPLPNGHPLDTWTTVSYSLALIDLSIITRSFVDLVNIQPPQNQPPRTAISQILGQKLNKVQRESIDRMFQAVASKLPPHYSLEAAYGQIRRSDVERWLLHQQFFHLFLQLHMPVLAEADRPHGSCIFMANHILEIQGKISNICPILEHLSLNASHTLRGVIVLILGLFYAPSGTHSGLTRMMTRRKVESALENMDAHGSSVIQLCQKLVGLLLEVEEAKNQMACNMVEKATKDSSVSSTTQAAVDLEMLSHKLRAICQALDVLMNEGYWRTFRKNLKNYRHLIPDWLLKPYSEAGLLSQENVSSSSSSAMIDSNRQIQSTKETFILQPVVVVDEGNPSLATNDFLDFDLTFDMSLPFDVDLPKIPHYFPLLKWTS